MAKKYYAVKGGNGGVSGIYLTWEECKAQVAGVSGVQYKSFPTLEEAEAFLRGETAERPGEKPMAGRKKKGKEAPPELPYRENTAIAYTDGSYNKATGEFSGAAVLFYNREKEELAQKSADPKMAEMHNVAGEIMAAVMVLRYCMEQGIPAVEIYHDYAGVGRWATGAWKANKPGTQAYAAFCKKAMSHVETKFIEVTGHSGNYWNDYADGLAKAALGIK